MADPLLIKMDELTAYINQLLNNNDEIEEKAVIENAKTTPIGNSKYLDSAWTIDRKTELAILKSNGFTYRPDKNIDENIERPIGHNTHNLFLKDKKSKQRFLITHHQSHKLNFKDLAKKLKEKEFKIKELRMDSHKNRHENNKKYFGFNGGCITALSLLNISSYDKENGLQWIVDSNLIQSKEQMSSICAGCADPNDHSQHHVVDIPMTKVMKLVESIGIDPVVIDF